MKKVYLSIYYYKDFFLSNVFHSTMYESNKTYNIKWKMQVAEKYL